MIETDYTSYALVHSCSLTAAKSIFISEYVWMLSRTAHVEGTQDFTDYMDQMTAIMDAKIPSYDQSKLRNTIHGETENNCQYATFQP